MPKVKILKSYKHCQQCVNLFSREGVNSQIIGPKRLIITNKVFQIYGFQINISINQQLLQIQSSLSMLNIQNNLQKFLTIRYLLKFNTQMIRRANNSKKHVANSIPQSKVQNQNENNIKKKLFCGKKHPKKPQASSNLQNQLKQITNNFAKRRKCNIRQENYPNERQFQLMQERNQRNLNSQTSVNDLSQIVPIDFLCSQKKQFNIESQLRNKLPNSQNINRKYQSKQQRIIGNKLDSSLFDQTSFQIDDLQILDVYQTQRKSGQKSKGSGRKSGGIRRCSKGTPHQSVSKSQQQQHSAQLTKQSQSNIFCDVNQRLEQEIINSGQKIFHFISSDGLSIQRDDLQRCPLQCEIKLILGPILTKLRQTKYSELNLTSFLREFSLILRDFSEKQRFQIAHKIHIDRHIEPQVGTSYDQLGSDRHKYFEFNLDRHKHLDLDAYEQTQGSQVLCNSTQLIDSSKQERVRHTLASNLNIQHLHQKVDSYLNKIRQGYNKNPQNQFTSSYRGQSGSQLSNYHHSTQNQQEYFVNHLLKGNSSVMMGHLEQIQQISGQSEDLNQKGESSRIVQLSKEAYIQSDREFDGQLLGSQKDNLYRLPMTRNYQLIQSNYRRNGEKKQQNHLHSYHKTINAGQKANPNDFQRQVRKRFPEKLFQTQNHMPKKTRISLNSINLEFNQLSKYLD